VRVPCAVCGEWFDDTYHWTYCPHEFFQMRTHVYNSKGFVGVATTIEELDRMMKCDT